jgi:AcrR family transcriptional regulator
MTTGNNQEETVARRTGSGPTRERFIQETLALIAERGGSGAVNLREISRRVGCAHTNAYNYFTGFDDLLWAAFRQALRGYGVFLVRDLDDSLRPDAYLRRVVTNLAGFPQEHPGLYRFIGSDPIDVERIPADILEAVVTMKRWLTDTIKTCLSMPDDAEAERIGDIVLAYVDGETLNLINGRTVPGEDIGGRIVDNAMRLFELLAGDGIQHSADVGPTYPELDVAHLDQATQGGR